MGNRYQNWSVDQWNPVILIDESRFCISFGDHCLRIWRKSHERCNVKYVKKKKGLFSQYGMVWGCVSATNVRKICFLKRSLNAAAIRMSKTISYKWRKSFGAMNSSSSMTLLLHTRWSLLKNGSRRGIYLFLIGLQIAQTQIQWKSYRESPRGD